MKLRIGVLTDPSSWHGQDFLRAAARHTVSFHDPRSLNACLDHRGASTVACGVQSLNQLDAVFLRTIPAGSLDQIVFRMDALAELQRNGVAVVNPAKTIEACVDKYLALCLLARAGIPVPETRVCQTAEDALAAFEKFDSRAVLKPVFGSEGRGILMLENSTEAREVFSGMELAGQTIYLQRFVEHQNRDVRLFVAGQELRAMSRFNACDWRVNAARGGQTAQHQPTPFEIGLAFQTCQVLGAVVAGIDLVYDRDGKPYVLEVNSAPGWKHLAHTLDCDVASLVVRAIESETAVRSSHT